MTIRDFWHDIRDRFLDDDRNQSRWSEGQRRWRGEQRDDDRERWSSDYDRSGRDRHYSTRGMSPMGAHGLDRYREPRDTQWHHASDDRYAQQHERDWPRNGDAGNRWRHTSGDRGRREIDGSEIRYASDRTRAGWPDRYTSASALRDHRGRGPSNWQRSDTRLYEEVCECFMEDDDLDPSDIEVKVEGGVVTLTGTVENRADKRHAEELAERIPGVRDVHNEIKVMRGRDTFLGTRDALRDSSLGQQN